MDDWRAPYRSMDASGSPDSAGTVGWTWMYDLSRAEHARDPRALELDHPANLPAGGTCVLYRDHLPIAAYFVIRDPLNFAVLIRWRAPELNA